MDLKHLLKTPPWEWPKKAGTILLGILSDKQSDPDDRLVAAELAGELVVMNDELAGALVGIVGKSDEPEDLRATVAIALGPVLEQGDMELLDDEGFDDAESVPISLGMFRNIQDSLRRVYLDDSNPKDVRRKALEASVRSRQDWLPDAIKSAYASRDKDWALTAVFAMGYVRGFESEILAALDSGDPQIHFQAIRAAGNWELDAAWPHAVKLIENPATPKPLLMAAIEAVGSIRPKEAGKILAELAYSRDEDIAEAANEAMAMAQAPLDEPEDDENGEEGGGWIN